MKFFILSILILFMVSNMLISQNIEKSEGFGYNINGESYTAVIDPEKGMLSSLNVYNEEFLEKNIPDTFPSYFLYEWVPRYSNLVYLEGNKLTTIADNIGKAEITFESNKITFKITNLSEKDLTYCLVLSRDITAVVDTQGKVLTYPVEDYGKKFRWIKNYTALTTEGNVYYCGQWHNGDSININIAPLSENTLVIETTNISKDELLDVVRKITPNEDQNQMIIYSPKEYEVFQRQSKFNGNIYISGKMNVICDTLEYKITGKGINGKNFSKSWKKIKKSDLDGSFGEYISGYAGGWYSIEIRAIKDKKEIVRKKIEKVGIGEVFVGAGQSNSTNSGQFKTVQKSGMIACTDGINWQYAADPLIGVHDYSNGGSFYLAMGDILYEEFKVPIGIASAGHGATSVNQWLPGAELYDWIIKRINQLGKNGFRAILWHQGESDPYMFPDEYVTKMTSIVKSSNHDAKWSFPWFSAMATYNPYATHYGGLRDAFQELWYNRIMHEGPDTDSLMGDMRDFDGEGIHFSIKGLETHGKMWAEFLIPYIKSKID